MQSIDIHPTSTAQWHALVKDARDQGNINLTEELESYLVFLLMRFTGQPEIAQSVLALEFLQSTQVDGQQRYVMLRDVGDKCLLYSGLFPGRAEKRRVRLSYFVELGQSAYSTLSEIQKQSIATLYNGLANHFVPMMDTLHAMRDMNVSTPSLTPLDAMQLWQDTGSQYAFDVLRAETDAIPIGK